MRGLVLVLIYHDHRVPLPVVDVLWCRSCSPGKRQASASNPRASWWYQAGSWMSGLLLFFLWSWASYLTSLNFSFHICKMWTVPTQGLSWRLNEQMCRKDLAQYLAHSRYSIYSCRPAPPTPTPALLVDFDVQVSFLELFMQRPSDQLELLQRRILNWVLGRSGSFATQRCDHSITLNQCWGWTRVIVVSSYAIITLATIFTSVCLRVFVLLFVPRSQWSQLAMYSSDFVLLSCFLGLFLLCLLSRSLIRACISLPPSLWLSEF